jgi:hypothetical protein
MSLPPETSVMRLDEEPRLSFLLSLSLRLSLGALIQVAEHMSGLA